MKPARLAAIAAALILLGAAVLFVGSGRAPAGGYTFVVRGERAEQVAPGSRYLRLPGSRVVHIPTAGRFSFPDVPTYKLFSRDRIEIPAAFEVSWRLEGAGAGTTFALSGRKSFENDVVKEAFRQAARPAALSLSAADIYGSQGHRLVVEMETRLALPVGVTAEVHIEPLFGGPAAQGVSIGPGPGLLAEHRVVFIGVDALDWKILDDLRAQGRLPAFDRLIKRGVRADMKTLTPMLSPLLWTSMATGVGPDRHGILDFLQTDPATGKQIPATSARRRVPAFWNVATAYHRSVDVVGWLVTWPAEAISGHMVSDRFGFLAFAAGTSPDTPLPDAVYPPGYIDRATSLSMKPEQITYEEVKRFLDVSENELAGARQGGYKKGNLINNFVLTYATARTYRNIGVDLVRGRPDLAAVYLEWLDAMGHLFMPYAPPRQPDVSPADFDRYHNAITGAYLETDRILGSLLDAAGDSAVVILASDHGFRSGETRPTGLAAIEAGTAARWHRNPAVLIMAGPGIKSGVKLSRASVLDIAPTLLHLIGIPVSEEIEGNVLTEALTAAELEDHPVQTIERYTLPRDVWAPPAAAAASAGAARAEPAAPVAAGDSVKIHVNLGLVLEQRGQLAEAEAEYRRALAEAPADADALTNLGNVLEKTGRFEEAVAAFQKVIQEKPDYRPAYQNLGICYLKRDDPAAALPWFDKAVAMEPGNVSAIVNRGHALLRLKRADAAEADFKKAVALSPEAANAHFGLGLVAAERGEYDAARREFEKTLALDPGHASARSNLERMKSLR